LSFQNNFKGKKITFANEFFLAGDANFSNANTALFSPGISKEYNNCKFPLKAFQLFQTPL
jgi:hypothetical protein